MLRKESLPEKGRLKMRFSEANSITRCAVGKILINGCIADYIGIRNNVRIQNWHHSLPFCR
jgi:hypothetical protein